ncbi:MAG TPA: hypothetical protein VMB27_01805 [Solirubrobacteraceae bacterium]|nr:hypothetical protein [Solirubrobacteraceae bacterium]
MSNINEPDQIVKGLLYDRLGRTWLIVQPQVVRDASLAVANTVG